MAMWIDCCMFWFCLKYGWKQNKELHGNFLPTKHTSAKQPHPKNIQSVSKSLPNILGQDEEELPCLWSSNKCAIIRKFKKYSLNICGWQFESRGQKVV